jgi:hypothetical protein
MKFLHKAFVEFDPTVWWFIAWALTVPLYIGLQTWFAVAWKGRWRIVALIPLIGVALTLVLTTILYVVSARITPDWPPFQPSDLLVPPIISVIFFAPLGFIYEAIVGIVRLSVRRTAARPA